MTSVATIAVDGAVPPTPAIPASAVIVAGTRIAINVHYGANGDCGPTLNGANGSLVTERGPDRSEVQVSPAQQAWHNDSLKKGAGDLTMNSSQQSEHETINDNYTNGPDQIIPSDDYFTSDKFGAVKLRIGTNGLSTSQPISVHTLLHRSAEKFGALPALYYKLDGQWQCINYRDYLDRVRCVARAFVQLGLEPRGAVCVLGFNSPQWLVACLAAIYAGGVAVGVYTTNNADACRHCAVDSGCQIFVVDDDKQLEKVNQFAAQLPTLRQVVQYGGSGGSSSSSGGSVISWQQLVDIGADADSCQLQQRVRRVAINQPAVMIYTSGTTGPPKGVMLSHDSLTYTALASCAQYQFGEGVERCVSYLPLSHIAALMSDVFVSVACGASLWFADKDALKGSLVNTLIDVRPTGFLGVPRVFEKMREAFEQKASRAKGFRRSLLQWTLKKGQKAQLARIRGSSAKPVGYTVARRLVLNKIQAAIGLDRARFLLCGAAPLAKDTISFFHSINLPLLQTYGMSESSGPHTSTWLTEDSPGSVGAPLAGFSVRLSDTSAQDGGQGEVCMAGRNVFMGYHGQVQATAAATVVDSEGAWLRTGDLGVLSASGLLTITGRSKELIITAGGENVPPLRVEHEVLKELPAVSHCCLIGDQRKFLSLLVTLKVEMEEMVPTDRLSDASLRFCVNAGSKAQTVSDIISGPDELVMEAIQEGINRANARAASNAQRVQKWTILPTDFSIAGGELGPTMKLKRPVVHKKYKDVIERFYQ